MKCPVCDNVNTSRVCIKCGFDSSRDYEKYPTFGSIGNVPAVSSLRQDWAQAQQKSESETVVISPPQKKKPRLLVAACAAILALGIGVGAGLGVKNLELTDPKDGIHMQLPESTVPPEIREANPLRSDEFLMPNVRQLPYSAPCIGGSRSDP